jgi:hypothetical protein
MSGICTLFSAKKTTVIVIYLRIFKKVFRFFLM